MDGAKKLAYLLEGCGAKYTRTIVIAGTLFTVSTGDGQYFVLVRNDDAGIEMWSRYFTPEQAIAATVGVDLNTGEAIRKLLDKLNTELCNAGCVVECETREERQRLIDAVKDKYAQAIVAMVGKRDTMGLWPEWEQVLFANVSDEVAQDNLNECVHELLDKAATVGAGTCCYIPDDAGFTWWDENDVEHYEEHSASDECCFASCDKCGNQMMVGEEGWFNGWDEITEWWEEDGSYHKGYVLEPRFKYCPNCGKRIVEEEAE